jgi:hypothetical protein
MVNLSLTEAFAEYPRSRDAVRATQEATKHLVDCREGLFRVKFNLERAMQRNPDSKSCAAAFRAVRDAYLAVERLAEELDA